MNRLIIVGNGFDLAHGLKTSYGDFIVGYLKTKIIQVLKTRINHSDNIMDVIINENISHNNGSINHVCDLKNLFINENLYWSNSQEVVFTHSSRDRLETASPLKIIIKSQFFANLLNKKGNWTDIEKNYFNALLETKSTKRYLKSKYKELNRDFEVIKEELKKYIQVIDNDFIQSIGNKKIVDLKKGQSFSLLFPKQQIHDLNFSGKQSIPNKYLIINFNYTNTVTHYLEKFRSTNSNFLIDLVDIHGNCQKDEIVFGYGDESHSSYQELEDQDDNELLKNMKSFYYGFSDAYSNLMEFIGKEDFYVDIIGHSLGLSDRLLFREIFERENCKEIKLFHRGSRNSYFNKRIALSRHFKDNTNMRNKVLGYSDKDVF